VYLARRSTFRLGAGTTYVPSEDGLIRNQLDWAVSCTLSYSMYVLEKVPIPDRPQMMSGQFQTMFSVLLWLAACDKGLR
jgi:hypothetical protein